MESNDISSRLGFKFAANSVWLGGCQKKESESKYTESINVQNNLDHIYKETNVDWFLSGEIES